MKFTRFYIEVLVYVTTVS